jgi:hypothetical protein
MSSPKKRRRTPVKSARSDKRKSPSTRVPDPNQLTAPGVPRAIEIAIENRRNSLSIVISLAYCLHSALRREIEDGGSIESPAVQNATAVVDLTDITAMLLARLDSLYSSLESVSLETAATRLGQVGEES